jgi:predicted MFS family arabinose efflux permease
MRGDRGGQRPHRQWSGLLPPLATDAFHLDGGGYATLVAAFGAGALPGALLATRSKGRPSVRAVVVLAASTTCSMAITAFAPDLVVGLVGLVLSGFASIWYIATANTLVQLRATAQLRCRVIDGSVGHGAARRESADIRSGSGAGRPGRD